VRSEVHNQFQIIILDTPAASATQIGIFNNTPDTISARITADNGDKGNAGFFKIQPGKYELWERSQWQVAFVLKRSEEASDSKAETLVVKPTGVYYINDE
jgi:hypothetical protein